MLTFTLGKLWNVTVGWIYNLNLKKNGKAEKMQVWSWVDTFSLIYNMMPDKNDCSRCKLAWMSSFPDNRSIKRATGDLLTKFSNAIGYHQTDL